MLVNVEIEIYLNLYIRIRNQMCDHRSLTFTFSLETPRENVGQCDPATLAEDLWIS